MIKVHSFKDSRERTIWVQQQLRLKGSSFAAIAKANGWKRGSVSSAMHMPSDAQEKAIAAELGVEQEVLFPERFDAEGQRFHPVKNKTIHRPRNVKNHSES
jgi:lambda repressor-like predicted transcriptional regulator